MIQLTLADISKHLTKEVINTAFKLKTGSEDEVKDIEISPAASAGTGLLGAVYRLKVIGEHKTAAFIVKGMIKNQLLRNSLDIESFCKREADFYSKVLPALKDIQKNLGAKERVQNNVPICYAHYCDGEDDYLLLEDLSETFCEEIPKHPTDTERDGILKSLAHFHAVSMALKLKNPEKFSKIADDLPEIYYNEENRKLFAAYIQNGINIDLEALAEFEDKETSMYYKKFAELVSDDIYGVIVDLATKKGKNAVICHGDAWFNNFLNSKTRTVILDFQILRCASPVTDLTFFLALSSQKCSNKDKVFDSLKVYHDALSYYLRDMGLDVNKIFPWDDFLAELKEFGRYGLSAALTTIPLLCSEKYDVLGDFSENYKGVNIIPLEDLWQLTPFKSEKDKMILVNAVRMVVDLGIL